MIKHLLWLWWLPSLALAVPANAPRPGGIAVVPLGAAAAAPEARFAGKRVLTMRDGDDWVAIVGIPLDQAPGTATLQVDNLKQQRSFTVTPHRYREQHLTVKPAFVNPDPETLERIARERELISAAIAHFSESPPRSLQLQPPIPGKRSDSFGSRRFFNGEPRSPHRGMDLSGARGTPIRAPLDGTVILAGDFYFTGNAVFLDHGAGLVSLYAHLDEAAVAVGDRVAAGDLLGTVGATGRVTGPHLHFAIYLNATPVDPALLLPE